MRILVSNDDGFHAEGIQVLAKELRKIADVVIVAPDRNRSAASSSLTLVEPLRPRHLDCGDYCVNELDAALRLRSGATITTSAIFRNSFAKT